jgi:hypothetical protein
MSTEEKPFGIIEDAIRYEPREYADGLIIMGLVVKFQEGCKCPNCESTTGFVYIKGPH